MREEISLVVNVRWLPAISGSNSAVATNTADVNAP